MPISPPPFRAAGILAGLLLGLSACASQDSLPLVTAPPASELSTPAPGTAPAATPARGTAGMTMPQLMARCAEMRRQGSSPAAMTPATRRAMAQCDAMDRAHGQPAPSGR